MGDQLGSTGWRFQVIDAAEDVINVCVSFLRLAPAVSIQPAHLHGDAVGVHGVIQGAAVPLGVFDEKRTQVAEARTLM